MAKPPNALAMYLGGPLDEQMSSLVSKFGADAVRSAAKQATAKRRGRRPEKDWVSLKPWVNLDADDWLNGRDPFAKRSNYAVAKAFAEQFPGHNPFATKERIERKLREKRRWFMLAIAMERSKVDFPAELHLRTLRELAELNTHPVWAQVYENALGRLVRYREKFGDPGPAKSFEQLDAELNAQPPALAEYGNALAGSGLFGSRRVQKVSTISNP